MGSRFIGFEHELKNLRHVLRGCKVTEVLSTPHSITNYLDPISDTCTGYDEYGIRCTMYYPRN